jgi:uroporphyrin-III C-methyltransferase/precorrin-2 dehydrogenase/sirohydrochlorin ferrochelatase
VKPLFPAFLKLAGRRVLVVGGGTVAAARVASLVAAGASVTVVAPEVRPEIAAPGVRVERREFVPADIDGVWLVVAAATPAVNRAVSFAATPKGVFVNAVDDPENANVYLGGVVRRGGVTLAVSTDGRAPALAGLLREALEALIPEEIDAWIAEAARLRAEHKRRGVPLGDRRPLLLEALNRLYAEKIA